MSSIFPEFMAQYNTYSIIYKQRVRIPLEDLYPGNIRTKFVIRDAIWQRYRAAFRGGYAAPVMQQTTFGLLVPLLTIVRANIPASFVASSFFFHKCIPRPRKLSYTAVLGRGWKSGTKITFQDIEPGFTILFIIQEMKHKYYVRNNNDLLYKPIIRITETQRKNGCKISIPSLYDKDKNCTLTIQPNEIPFKGRKRKTQIKVHGMGWPKKTTTTTITNEDYGDLIVFIKVVRVKNRFYRRRKNSHYNVL